MFRRNKLFFWTTEILLITLIFYLWREMGAIITPFVSVVNTIMIPFLLGGFLYYLTNPIVIFLEKECRINRIIGILLTLCVLFGTIVIAVVYLLPILINQLSSLINSSQGIYGRLQDLVIELSKYPAFQELDIQQNNPTIKSFLHRYFTEYLEQCDKQCGKCPFSFGSALF